MPDAPPLIMIGQFFISNLLSFSLKSILNHGYYTKYIFNKTKNTGEQMKILVTVKRVIDYKTHIRIKADESGVETANVKMSMNPFDEIAVEEALRLKEKKIASEVVAVSIGPLQCQETLRTALAMGADRAIHVQTDADIQPLVAAKILKALIQTENPKLMLLGKQAIDNDNNQTGQMLAGLLHWPQATFASNVDVIDNTVTVVREVDGGLQTLRLQLPAVVTTDLRLNEPRFISLPNIVQAKRKPMDVVTLESLKIDVVANYTVLKVTAPQSRKAGVKVGSVSELMDKLRHEAKVLP
jgi:electron transfer flavoprotein beta subunit